MQFGFPTGKLSKYLNLQNAVDRNVSIGDGKRCIEFSAIKFHELEHILIELTECNVYIDHGISEFSFSIHLPTNFNHEQEIQIVDMLNHYDTGDANLILHPDTIHNFELWQDFRGMVLIENMDLRKKDGITVGEMETIFKKLPDANMCFDIGHARQVDPSMSLAVDIHEAFFDKILEIHISNVHHTGAHHHMNTESMSDFRKVLRARDHKMTSVIIETPSILSKMSTDLNFVELSFS